MHLCEKYIPQTTFAIRKHSHPWINTTCEIAVAKKNAAEGSPDFVAVRDDCAQTLREAHKNYQVDLRARIASLPRGSKRWWALNRELLDKKSRIISIPLLRQDDNWILDSRGKANIFAKTFTAKHALPPLVEDQFVPAPTNHMNHFVAIRTRVVAAEFSKLDEKKATGPDRISARILRVLVSVIALPLAIICRRLLYEGVWPDIWKIHFLIAIFKRGVVHNPGNYRGIHLTSIVSKVVERVIGNPLITYLQQFRYGTSQWAYRKRCSSRDLALMCFTSCVLAVCQGNKMAVYLSDISGACDFVYKETLMAKLFSIGVPDFFLAFLDAYLSPRMGYVTVAGVLSDVFDLTNMVFQGTVLGPTLWNSFFSDIAFAASSGGGEGRLFADDLNVFKKFPLLVINAEVKANMASTQKEVHRWGYRNRVSFDSTKEHLMIIHPVHGEGMDFRLLGSLIDVKLSMSPVVQDILDRARPKIKSLLRTRGMYNHIQMFDQYKTHVWNLIEYHNGVLLHACASQLQRIDSMQRGYVQELHLTEESALIHYNFAPPCLRRDIGQLGFLHKRILGQCHEAIMAFFPRKPHVCPWHDKQIESYLSMCTGRRALYERSIFQMVHVYNRLPQEVIDIDNISGFQACLTSMAKRRCIAGTSNWRQTFRTCLAYAIN